MFALAVLASAGTAVAQDASLATRDASEARAGPYPEPGMAAFLGVVSAASTAGLEIARVVEGSAAARCGLRAGDVIRRLNDRVARAPGDLDLMLRGAAPGDVLRIALERDGTLIDRSVTLGARRRMDRLFRGASFRLAVVPVLFADDDAPDVDAGELRRFFFAAGGRRGAGASVRDYFTAQSRRALDVDGVVLAPLRLSLTRAAYASREMGAGQGSPFREAAAVLGARDGAAALRGIDGVAFLYDGATETTPGRALWPHRAVVSVGGRRLPYYVHSSATVRRGEIGEHCHEFGHLLGLEDMYGAGHRTGAGDFCVMAIGHRGGASQGAASPFGMCAPCRLRLGWLDHVTVDPAAPQRLRIAPADSRRARAVVLPLDRATSEFLLLEVRGGAGFDAELPSRGLLVWRVGGLPTPGQGVYGSRVDLVEAHGLDTFDASLVRPREIAFPTKRTRDLTPTTWPSSSSARPGTFDVHLTDIVRDPGGAVVVTIGVARSVRQAPPVPRAGEMPDAADARVSRVDPVTGETIVFELAAGSPAAPLSPSAPSRR